MAIERYNAVEAEARWQKLWDERGIFATRNDDPRPKYYVLEMFPYPSGRIHMGHVRNYTMGDVVARVKRATGFAVLHPMGWDAFGLPAENAAAERKIHPKAWTYDNIAAMKAQLKSMGLSLDWSREIATCDPAYYKHQQKMFLDFLARGPGRAAQVEGELGPGRSDCARERAGDRRPRLALRRGNRAARADAVVFQDHRLLAGSAGRPRSARPLAGKSAADAEELDRPLRGASGPFRPRPGHGARPRERTGSVHDAARHSVRRQISGAGAGPSARCNGGEEQSGARPLSSKSAAIAERRRPRSIPRRRWGSTPASRRCIRSIRPGRCRSMSPISS